MGRFKATGTLSFNALDSKVPYIKEGKTGKGAPYKSFNMSVASEPSNRMYLESFGMKSDTIKFYDTDGNQSEVDWADRNDSDILETVRGAHVVNLTGEKDDRKTFLTEWDMIDYLCENIDEMKNKKFTVTGRISKNFYQGKCSDRFQIQNVYLAAEDAKPELKIFDTFYWDKDSLDADDFAEDKKIYLNGYVQAYLGKDVLGSDKGGNRYVAQQAVLDCSKLDFENEKHMKVLQFKLLGLGLKYENGKIKQALKAKGYVKNAIEFNYQNGSEAIEFSEDELTDFQKSQVELGLKKLEDFRPQGQGYGPRVTLYKIFGFDSRGDFADGLVVLDDTRDEFEDEIFVQAEEETIGDIMNAPEDDDEPKKSKSKAKVEEDEDDDLDDLFS